MNINNEVINNKAIDYIEGYTVDNIYHNERMYVNNLYDGISIIGDYDVAN